ncbi:ROK family protein [Phragmitibacter flavus]|uniref:ROK family protein n=1 Tax=Phragmitibacter flavus TaxID=2576071 RepID=A0A5R8K9T7_9BACT|nr:ROK family protein [Phragmitibacter flavus]TLD68289.1 ROK family protein [Phragmitibacter flavus]
MAKKVSSKKKSKKTVIKKVLLPSAPVDHSATPFWIGFDLGGTKMMACVLDENYNVLGTARKSSQGTQGAAKGIKRILTTMTDAMLEAGVNPANLQGAAVACPGTVNPQRGILITAPNLGWRNITLGPSLQRVLKKPVILLNDVDAGTFGEYTLGAGKGARSLLGIFPGTGLGAGFVYDGKLIHGKATSCMELGMVYLPGTHLNSAIPGAVLFEDLTSRLGLAAAGGIECIRGNAPILDAKTGASMREMKSKALTASCKAAEPGIVPVLENSLNYLGMGVAMVINLFAPDQITLGGGLVEEMPKTYLDGLKQYTERYAVPELFKGIKFSVAQLGGNAVAIGAVAWLRKSQ